MGSNDFAIPTLQHLLSDGRGLSVPVTVVGAVTQPDRRAGRGRIQSMGPVKRLAIEYGITVLQPNRVREPHATEEILGLQPDVLIVASFGQILPSVLVEAPPRKTLNLHPSLLPRLRGPSPIAGAILDGVRLTGTTLMRMVAKMDAGPILDQEQIEVGPDETAGELTSRLAAVSAEMMIRDLPAWLSGDLKEQSQAEDDATYTRRITKEDGLIDWRLPADVISRRVRAFDPWPTAFTFWSDKRLRIVRGMAVDGDGEPGRVADLEDGHLRIGTGEGVLGVSRLQLAGSKVLSAEVFVRGHPQIVGARLESETAWS